MGKNLLIAGICVGTLLVLGACTGAHQKSETAFSAAQVKDADNAMKYYNASLVVLKNLVKEKDVNAVLGYMEQGGKAPMIAPIAPPAVSQKDSAEIVNPGSYLDEEERMDLIRNYTLLFRARAQFYATFNKYLLDIKSKKPSKTNDLLNANYRLSLEMSECKQNIFDILSPVATGAQKILLADNPLIEQEVATKKMTATMQSIVNLYARKHFADKVRLDLKIVELQLQLDTAKNLPAVEGHPEEMKIFQNFLSKVDVFLNKVQKVKEKNDYTDEDYDALNSAFETSII